MQSYNFFEIVGLWFEENIDSRLRTCLCWNDIGG